MTKFELWSTRGGGSLTPTKLGSYDTIGEAQAALDLLLDSKSTFKWQGMHIISVKG